MKKNKKIGREFCVLKEQRRCEVWVHCLCILAWLVMLCVCIATSTMCVLQMLPLVLNFCSTLASASLPPNTNTAPTAPNSCQGWLN